MDRGQLHLAATQFVIAIERRQMPVDRGDQVVVNRQRHVVVKQGGLERTGVSSGLGIIDVALDRSSQRRGQGVLMGAVLLVELVKGLLADTAFRRVQKGRQRGVAQFDPFAPFVLHQTPFQIGIAQLAENLVRGLGHFALHGQQFFAASRKRVRFVAQHPLDQQAKFGQFLGRQKLFHHGRFDRHDLRPDETGRLRRLTGGVPITPQHPLILAVRGILGGLQKRIGPQPLASPIKIGVEPQAGGQRAGIVAQPAAKGVEAGDLLFPLLESRFPSRVVGAQAGQIPGVGGLDLAAPRKGLDFARLFDCRTGHKRFVPRLFLKQIVRAAGRVLPAENRRSPGQTGTEAADQHPIARMDTTGGEGFVQGQGDAAGRGIAVTIEVDEHFVPIDSQLLGGGVQDANVRLMQDDQIEIIDRQAGARRERHESSRRECGSPT